MTREIKQKIAMICEVLGVDCARLFAGGARQKGMMLWARFIVAHELTEYGLKKHELAALMGKDRTTVAYYLQKYGDEYQTCPLFRDLAREVKLIRYMPYVPVG